MWLLIPALPAVALSGKCGWDCVAGISRACRAYYCTILTDPPSPYEMEAEPTTVDFCQRLDYPVGRWETGDPHFYDGMNLGTPSGSISFAS